MYHLVPEPPGTRTIRFLHVEKLQCVAIIVAHDYHYLRLSLPTTFFPKEFAFYEIDSSEFKSGPGKTSLSRKRCFFRLEFHEFIEFLNRVTHFPYESRIMELHRMLSVV